MNFGIAARLSLILAAVVVVAAGLTGYYAYDISRGLLIESAKNELLTSTKVLARRLALARAEVSRNLQLLSNHPAAVAALETGDPRALDQLAVLFELVMKANPGYFQVRLIAARDSGLESVRIDRDGTRLMRVAGDDLQEKAHFQYVFDALQLAANETYLSRIVINHEDGAHSGLEQPTVQLAMPVLGRQGSALGVVVINVDLNGSFASLAADLPKDFQLFVTNSHGDFLIHPDPAQTFGFDKGRRSLIQEQFTATRELVSGHADQVLIEASAGPYAKAPVVAAFIARKITFSSEETQLIFGLAQPFASILEQADKLAVVTLRVVLILCAVCILLAALVARAVTRPINSMSRAAQHFAEGYPVSGLPLERQDEIGMLARSFQRMQNQIRQQLAELLRRRAELEQLAQHDALTGLPNRVLFAEHAEHALTSARRDGTRLALMFIDIDKFKLINDNLGHAVGDLLLREFSARLCSVLRESDTPARIGGDEFVVLLHTVEDEEDASIVAEKLRLAINQPFVLEGHSLIVSACIGIALYPEAGSDLLELSRHADQAMYRAKENGRNAVTIYSPTAESS